jgi:uncharacterized protein (DUF2062 family)
LYTYFYNKIIRPIFTINDTPHAIALGVSLGVFIGLTPTVGYQMILVLILGTLLRANRIIAILLTWMSNPITAIPMYYGYYWVGCKILSVEHWTFSTFSPKLQSIWSGEEATGFWTRIAGVFAKLASEIGLPLFLGSLIIATVVSVPLYPWTLRALRRYRKENGFNNSAGTKPGGASGAAKDKELAALQIGAKAGQGQDQTKTASQAPAEDCLPSLKREK